MSDQKNILHDDSNGLDYVLVGDYYLPMMDLPEETRPIGYWGMLRKEYMKNYKSGMYSYLLLTGKLDSYLADLNEQAQERYELIGAQMRSVEGVTEELKVRDSMEWVRKCNNIRNRVQEIVLSELVYV
ncbi:TnpV protein [Blautia obeum]|uniref:TnpV protein n=1 Tax=Blautia obeum TaxID=40520 RepID=UPI000E48E149|nr:TnpV protein [Blautia obeum]RHA46801.1 TnpV protein [Blautia obeum]